MKLATKKLFHNALAIMVSVCMVCTLTPSFAWASNSGSASSEQGGFIGADDATASGESKVMAKVVDPNFQFTEMTESANYATKNDFVTALGSNPLKAVFGNKDSIPENYTIVWNVQEIQENPDYDSTQPDSDANKPTMLVGEAKPIFEHAYTKETTPKEEDGIPTFTYPTTGSGTKVEPKDLPMTDGKSYEFSIKMTNTATGDEAHATTVITLLPDYNPTELFGVGETVENSGSYKVEGDIYTKFSFPGMHYPELSVSSVEASSANPAYAALQEAASGKAEEIGDAAQLTLVDVGNPDDKDPYLNKLSVYIPLPDGFDASGKTNVNVYGYNAIAPATSQSVTVYPGEIVTIEDEHGNTVSAARIEVSGTGATLGAFAVGMPSAGSYTIYTSADKGGLISPSGNDDGIISGQPIGSIAKFKAMSMTTGYKLAGFEVRIGAADATPLAADEYTVDGNLLEFNPVDNGVADGGSVWVHAKFDKVEKPGEGETAKAHNVRATLKTDDGAAGSMSFGLAEKYEGAPGSKDVQMGQSNVSLDGRVNGYAGIEIEFSPNEGSTVDDVKVNGETLWFDHGNQSVMIGAISEDTNIEVSYRKLKDGEQLPDLGTVTVTGALDTSKWPSGHIRAMLVIDGKPSQTITEHGYETTIGSKQTIELRHTRNYKVKATQIDAKGVSTDVTEKVVEGDTLDSLTLYNVIEDVRVEFEYIPKEAEITGTAGAGGSGAVIIDPTQQPDANSSLRASMSTMSLRAADSVSIEGDGETLEEGHRARVFVRPEPGYELGRVEVNGTNVTDYFKPFERDGKIERWTLTVIRTETGDIPSGTGEWELEGWEGLGLYDEVIDNVVPIESSSIEVKMTFNPKVPTSPTYQTIRTHVEGVGGSITPSFKAEQNTTATVNFFPEDTYKVDQYKIDNGEWVTVGDNASSLACEVPVGKNDHDVYVKFKPGSTQGKPASHTVTPLASAGGSISPGEPVPVYETGTFNFNILPKTGYDIAEDGVKVEPADACKFELNGYTCTIKEIKADCQLSVNFEKSDSTPDPTHTVSVRYNEQGGTVTPAGPFPISNGSNVPFTFWPNEGWYVKSVYAMDEGKANAFEEEEREGVKEHGTINLAGAVQDGRLFTLNGVQEDTVLVVRFAELSEDPSNPGRPDPNDPNTPPALNLDDTFKLSSKDNCELGEGATISPNLAGMEFIKAKNEDGSLVDPVHAAAGSNITVIVASGYALDDSAENGGITIKNGDSNVTDKVSVKPAGDGLYEVTIPAENVTPDMKIIVKTKKNAESQGVINEAKVTVKVSGNGKVSPSGIDGVIKSEAGKSQTFTFIPDPGWKLHRVYVDGNTVSVTGNSYTLHNIQGEKTEMQAVFVPLEEGEAQPEVVTHDVKVTSFSDSGKHGEAYPSGVTQVEDGSSLSILVKPDAGYKAVAYEYEDDKINVPVREVPIVGNTIELADIKSNLNIAVRFDAVQESSFYNLSVDYGEGGSVSPAGNMLVPAGTTQTLSILPDRGKAVKDIWLTKEGGTSRTSERSGLKNIDGKGITFTTPEMSEKMAVYVEFCNATDGVPGLPTGDDLRGDDGKTTYHNVTAFAEGGGGSVLPSSAHVANGASVAFAIVPLEGYHFKEAFLRDAPLGAWSPVDNGDITNNGTRYELEVTKDVDFKVVFEKDDNAADLDQYYTVFASSIGDGSKTTAGAEAGGRISPEGPVTVSGGGSQSFTILPDPNCKVSEIVITNTSTETKTTIKDFKGSSYTLFGVDKDMNFTVFFTALKSGESGSPSVLTHSIAATSSLNGSISPTGTRTVDDGGNAMFTFVPWDGYKLSYAIVDGLNVPASRIANLQYTFSDVKEDHSIHAVFIGENEQAADFVTINVSSNKNGTVSPSGATLVEKDKGKDLAIEVTPFLGYKVKDIHIDDGTEDGISLNGANGGHFDFTSGSIPGNGKYKWSNGVLTLTNVDGSINGVAVEFDVDGDYVGGSGEEGIPEYEKLGSTVSPAGFGSTNIQPDPIYIEKPGDGAEPEQTTMDISIIPEEGKIAEEIVVDYGDGSKTVYEDDGKYEYNQDGNLVDSGGNVVTGSDGNPIKYPSLGSPHRPTSAGAGSTAQDVYESGYITVDTTRGDVNVDVKFRDLTEQEKQDIEDGTLTPATFFDVNVTYSSGGTVGSSGVVKVAEGSSLTLQMVPSNGYEVASVTVDGKNRTSEVTNTRTFILGNVQANQNVDVAFGFVKKTEDETTWKVTAEVKSPAESGSVSIAENTVRDGASQVVYFLPSKGYKVGMVKVARDGEAPEENADYNSMTYTVRNIHSNVGIEVEFVKAAPGEPTWSVDSVSLDVKVGAGNGKATPEYSEVPVGSASEISFYPDDGWRASYYTLNGKTTYLPTNVGSWPVMPDATEGAENEMLVFFERMDNNGVDSTIEAKVDKGDDGEEHGSAAPPQASVSYGGSTTFYVYPDSGYTIDYVRFNGSDQASKGVVNPGFSTKQTIKSESGNVSYTGASSLVSDSDVEALASGNTYYDAYAVTLNDVTTSGTLNVKFKKIPNGTGTMVSTSRHKMTITSMGGGMVGTLGEVWVPEGETVEILTTAFESYYLASVIQSENGGAKKTDLTGSVEGRIVKARMGKGDCSVEITFNRVGEPAPPVYALLGKMTYNGNDILVDVGGYINPENGELVPSKLNGDGVICDNDGNPIEFVRGGAYEFYFNPKAVGENGRELVIESAKYDGKDISIVPGANYLTNVVLNSSAAFDIVFRELEEGEQVINPSKGYTVTIEWTGNGSVSPAGPLTRQPGGSTGPLALRGNSDNFAVSSITLKYKNDGGQDVEETVPSTEYADGTYNYYGIDRDITISVVFDEYSIVRVEWDNSMGFISPNHAEGSYIYRPVGTANLPFVVAPYVDNDLVNVLVGSSAESAVPVAYSDDEKYADQLNEDLGITPEGGGAALYSMADTPNVAVQPVSTDFAKVYGFTAPIVGKSAYVKANFRSTKEFPNHYITASVKSGKGAIEPSGEVEVAHGADKMFRFVADPGYTISALRVDGKSESVSRSYTFNNVTEDHSIEVEFGLPQGGGSGADRLVRVLSGLAKTGDLTGPAVGCLLLIAAMGLTVTAVSYIRRRKRLRR